MTLRELNRATLARQLLLVRARASVARALERIGGIQAQDVGAPYDALFARLEGFRREALERALERRLAIRGTLMRGTLHIVSARDYPPFIAALLPSLRRQYSRARLRDAPPERLDELAERALAFATEPRTYAELREHLGGEDEFFRARFHLPFVHAPPISRRPRIVAARSWLELEPVTEEEAVAHLVRRYLAAFGPATAKDAARWAGIPVSTVRAGLERVRTVDLGDGHLDLVRAPRPGEVTAAPRLLPLFESILLGYDDRSRFLTKEHYDRVMLGGMVLKAFLVDGVVAGVWRTERETLTLEPFAPLPRVARRELQDEAERVATFHDAAKVRFA
jgi:hypothetical protein